MSAPAADYDFTDLHVARRALQKRFDAFARKIRATLLLEQMAKWLALVIALALATFILDRTFRLSLIARRGLLVTFLLIVVARIWSLRWPLRLRLSPDVLASALEKSAGQSIAARTATLLGFPSIASPLVSQSMMASAMNRCRESLAGINFVDQLDPRRRRIALRAIVAMLIASLGLIFASPSSARLWAARLFAGSNQPWPQRTFLQVAGLPDANSMIVPRDEHFVLRASAKPQSVWPSSVAIRWRQTGAPAVSTQLTQFGPNDFRYDFPPLQSDATVELSGGDDRFGPFTVRPVDRPRITSLRLTSQHPTESRPQVHNFSGEDSSDLSFLPFTRLALSFTANIPIAQVHLTSSTTRPVAGDLQRQSDCQFEITWQHFAPMQLQLELTSAEGNLTSAPTNLVIALKTDKPPRTTLGFSGVRQHITPQATIPLVAEARDDYAVEHMELQIRTEVAESEASGKFKTTATTQPLFGPSTRPDDPKETYVRQTHSFIVSQHALQPGHLLTFTASATDNCYPQPQTSSSREVTFRVVRPEELFKEILIRQQSERARFRKQFKEAQSIRQDVGTATSSDAISQLARRHRAMQREVGRVQSVLADSLTEMRLNALGNADAYQLMEKGVLAPMKALDEQLMTPQRDALESLAPADPAALAAIRDRQDQIISRMQSILQQMAQWDSFIDVLNQLSEIIRLENQVQQGTSQLKKQQTEGVFDP
jgi:hypothetical protein